MNQSPQHVVVIGAGWAGLAAAYELAKRNVAVTLLEQAPVLGGRARAAVFKPEHALPGDEQLLVDNGQHLLMGAYSETLRLINELHPTNDWFDRFPVHLQHSQGFEMRANRWPAPLHLASAWMTAKGLDFKDRFALVYLLANLKARAWLTREIDQSVSQLLSACFQPTHLINVLWRPLCLSALNTPPAMASAKVFAAVMRDTLGAQQASSDFLIANVSLGQIIPDAIERFLLINGQNKVVKGFSVRSMAKTQNGRTQWQIYGRNDQLVTCDSIIIATPWETTQALLSKANISPPTAETIHSLPIVTVYLYWRHTNQNDPQVDRQRNRQSNRLSDYQSDHQSSIQKQRPLMLADNQGFGQWFFDLGPTPGGGRLGSVVISGPGDHEAMDRIELAQAINRQVARETGWIAADSAWAITEKRATFACTVGLKRPLAICADTSVQLCGDIYQSEYPATLETAIRSGIAAAKRIN